MSSARISVRIVVGLAMAGLGFPAIAASTVCTKLTGGLTRVSSAVQGTACVGCTVLDAKKAIDGDLATYATIVMPVAVDGSARLRATAQPGVVFPAGNKPGVIIEIEKQISVGLDVETSVRTYLKGKAQAGGETSSSTMADVSVSGLSRSVLKTGTTQPFDAVEFEIGGSMSGYDVKLFEFCSDISKK